MDGGAEGRHVGNRWWPERATSIAVALDILLERLEELYTDAPPMPIDPTPLATGVDGLDRVCSGLRRGVVTLVEADQPAQGHALACSVARTVGHRALLAVESTQATTNVLLAGSAGVPAVLISTGRLSESDWDSITAAVNGLAERELSITDSDSMSGVGHVVRQQLHVGREHGIEDPTVLVVHDLARFGKPQIVVPWLVSLSATTGVATLAVSGPLGDAPESITEGTVRVLMSSHDLAGRATFVSTGDLDPLSVSHVEVDILTGDLT